MKVALHSLGCKVNAYETEAMGRLLREAGYELVPFEEGADIYIINTCTVTNIADRKSRQMLHRAKKMNPEALVVAAGCYVQAAGEKIQADDSIDLVIGNNKKKDLISILQMYEEGRQAEALIDINHTKEYEELSVTGTAEHTRAYVKVQDGCNQFCSYCIIPYARGRVRSRRAEEVLGEVERLSANGYQEVVLTGIHLLLNLWIVPASQAKFYDTQWNLRYGLAHMKLQESAFTEMADGLVVYVDKVSGHDLSQVMLSDTRDEKSQMTIFAEKGKLIATARGLSIVMTNGALQAYNDTLTAGTFDSFDMDLNVADKSGNSVFKVRRIPTWTLIKTVATQDSQKQHKLMLAELCTRFLGPVMNLILAALCALILLRSSLLRRRASFAPAVAVGAMAAVMALFMSATNMIGSLTELGLMALAQMVALAGIMIALSKK